MIEIRYFASLRERLGRAEESFEPLSGVATVGDLRARLCARGDPWAEALGEGETVMSAVNQAMARDATPIADGDEVAFFPPVTGG